MIYPTQQVLGSALSLFGGGVLRRCEASGEPLSGRAAIDIIFSDVSEVLSKSRAQNVPLKRS
jgi:hypothetical protein